MSTQISAKNTAANHDGSLAKRESGEIHRVDPGAFEPLEITEPQVSPEQFCAELVEVALRQKASDLYLLDEVGQVVVRVRRDGVLREIARLTPVYGHRVRNHFRAVAGTDVGDYLAPAEGCYWTNTASGQQVFVRLNAIPTLLGQDVSLRLFDQRMGHLSLESVGYEPDDLRRVQRMLGHSSGLVLVAGPTGSGKTTTLYACIRHLNNGERKIQTLEEPVEYLISGVSQSQVNLRRDLDFSDLLYASMRSGPDVIVIGEIRDQRTAELAVRAGGSGQLVLGTIHAHSATGAIQAMLAYGAHPHFLANCLLGIISQRLVRRLCVQCRGSIPLNEILDVLAHTRARVAGRYDSMESFFSLHYPVGCETCLHEGYRDRLCLAEVLDVTSELSRAISEGETVDRIRDIARGNGMRSLWDSASEAILRGETTVEEVNRRLSGLYGAGLAVANGSR